MRYAIISDIHANLEAMQAVKEDCFRRKLDRYIHLGDIVGYGANPSECIEGVKEIFDAVIAGNHDWAVVDKFDLSYFNLYAREAVEWTIRQLDEAQRQYLSKLPLTYSEENFIAVHGSLDFPEEFHYILNPRAAEATFKQLDKKICFVGHSHAPAIFSYHDGETQYIRDSRLDIEEQKKYIINVGSIGQPRDGNPAACYCVYSSDENSAEIIRVPYEVSTAQKKIIDAGLPYFLAERLAGGR